SADDILAQSVRADADVSAVANATENSVSIMVWNYHDDDLPAPATPVTVNFRGIGADRVLVSQYRIDNEYSNSYEAWKAMGSPQDPTPEQYRALEQSGQLQMNASPAFRNVSDGRLDVDFVLPRQGVALIRLSW
ncbi:MAG: beta-xylosidase, partial [Bacteroidales bacterium]|nr:beta-xylosidase [Bacteroidales bacterium]